MKEFTKLKKIKIFHYRVLYRNFVMGPYPNCNLNRWDLVGVPHIWLFRTLVNSDFIQSVIGTDVILSGFHFFSGA